MINEKALNEIAERFDLINLCDCFTEVARDSQLFSAKILTLDGYTSFDTRVLNKKGYESFYKFVDKCVLRERAFWCYIVYDYEQSYDMKNSNYLYLSMFFIREVSEKQLKSVFKIANKMIREIQNKWQSLVNNKNYVRKRVK